ncbi:MAG: hypothetical protein KC422_23055 [Trueperaceae bacterium]|nr:hypothetical protein [Trueperaceae bacterium]
MLSTVLKVGVIGFVLYNSTVILWELKKPNSQVCPKCANTRLAVGAALATVAGLSLLNDMGALPSGTNL